MPNSSQINVKDLKLDLKNFRTVPQKKEHDAVNALISISDDRFLALIESLIEDSYIPTENIIAIKTGKNNKEITVKEGNRRIAALKLIHGYLNPSSFNLPSNIISKISSISTEWKKVNLQVPCIVYESRESKSVDKIVSLTHGKGDKASRDKWPSIAAARHNRDMNKAPEPGLDLLEKYFKLGKNITDEQKEKWSGDYPITVLDEALPKLAVRIEEANSIDVANKYPNIKFKDSVEKILSNIGLKNIGFKEIRNSDEDFTEKYGIPPSQSSNQSSTNTSTATTNSSNNNSTNNNATNQTTGATYSNANTSSSSQTSQGTQSSAGQSTGNTTGNNTSSSGNSVSNKVYAINDPRGVTKILKLFNPSGLNRQKVVTLKNEALNLKLNKNPIAFCFLLRSMFEISVKAYFVDQNFSPTKANGNDKTLKRCLMKPKIT